MPLISPGRKRGIRSSRLPLATQPIPGQPELSEILLTEEGGEQKPHSWLYPQTERAEPRENLLFLTKAKNPFLKDICRVSCFATRKIKTPFLLSVRWYTETLVCRKPVDNWGKLSQIPLHLVRRKSGLSRSLEWATQVPVLHKYLNLALITQGCDGQPQHVSLKGPGGQLHHPGERPRTPTKLCPSFSCIPHDM